MARRLTSKVLFMLLLASSGIFGCADPMQLRWHATQTSVAATVGNIARENKDHLLDTVQLEQLLHAAPDFVGTPGELEELLAPEKDYRDRIMYNSFHAYLQYKGGAFGDLLGDRSWSAHTGFMECTLWIYDESAHFDRPLPGCAPLGFSADVFFIEKGKVIGTWPLVGWKPLRTLSGG